MWHFDTYIPLFRFYYFQTLLCIISVTARPQIQAIQVLEMKKKMGKEKIKKSSFYEHELFWNQLGATSIVKIDEVRLSGEKGGGWNLEKIKLNNYY